MRGVGGELTEGRIDGDPIVEQDFRPGVVVELAVDVGQAGGDARRKPDGPCQSDEQLGVLVTIARARLEHLQGARHAERDPLLRASRAPRC